MSVVHVKSDTIGDFTGTVTQFNSQGSTTTVAATDLVRPADWNSAHNFFQTITGQTAGTSTASGTNLAFGGTGGIQVSHSTAAGAATLWIGPIRESGYNPYPDAVWVAGAQGQGTLQFDPEIWPEFQCDRILVPINNTNSSNSSGSHTVSLWFGVYTRNNSSLSLLTSTSTSLAVTHSGTAGSYSLYSGMRLVTIPFTTTFTSGDYWLGQVSRTTSGGANGSYSLFQASAIASNFLGFWSSSHNTTYQLTLGQGVYTTTTSGIPGSVAFTQIRGSDSVAQRPTIVYFASSTI